VFEKNHDFCVIIHSCAFLYLLNQIDQALSFVKQYDAVFLYIIADFSAIHASVLHFASIVSLNRIFHVFKSD